MVRYRRVVRALKRKKKINKNLKINPKSFQRPFQIGFEFEKRYHGCAQSTIAALYEVFADLKNEDVFRAASGLGAGVGLSGQGHCGALSGTVMVLSQLFGRELQFIEDSAKKRLYAFRLGEELVQFFMTEFGTIICNEIHFKLMGRKFDLWNAEEKKAFEEMGAHRIHCSSVVGKAVKKASQMIERELRKNSAS